MTASNGLSKQHPCLLLSWPQGYSGAVHMAELGLYMQGTANSSHCIQQQTCQPLGGHSVWAATPPLLSETSPKDNMPVILVVAAADTVAFFHDAAKVCMQLTCSLTVSSLSRGGRHVSSVSMQWACPSYTVLLCAGPHLMGTGCFDLCCRGLMPRCLALLHCWRQLISYTTRDLMTINGI